MEKPREEPQILEDLATLAGSPGYVHAVAHICHRDNIIYIKGKLKPSDMDRLFSSKRLIRTELTTLIGLMVKKPLNLSQQPTDVIEGYVKRTDALLQELHNSMSYPMFASMFEAVKAGATPPNPWHGPGMREPIFYGTESAYAFQYRDLVPEKYGTDDTWMLKNKGFTSGQARTIAKTMCVLMDEKGTRLLADTRTANAPPATWLSAFEFSLDEVTFHSGVEKGIVEAFFREFLFAGDNSGFKEVGDFNEVAARPLLPTDRGTVLLFSHYAICEALYESPFFWMWDDKAYHPTAAKHRGVFTERFAARRLAGVFGREHVHTNVNLHRDKGIVGEADVLVIYGNRLIILQAKAKKLTIAARKGNDNQLKADFAAAIQDSYDQGWTCANELLAGGCRLVDDNKKEVELPPSIKEVFLFSLVSEHYPALAFQVNQSLKFQTTDVIRPPFVMDVFLLDTLTEMLATPLRLLSYVKLRVAVSDKLMSGHELTVLGYHLKKNLRLDGQHDRVMLEDSIARDLDTAMMVRRDNQPGDDTPVGILTKMRGTRYESLIKEIEYRADPATLELGFYLLSLDEDSCREVHCVLELITRKAQIDGKPHDFTLALSTPPCGISFHCNPTPSPEAIAVLEKHCATRKYQQRAAQWFGVSVSPAGQVQFGVTLNFPWETSDEMERFTADMKPVSKVRDALSQYSREVSRMKLGRNDPCHCGSGVKYKKCCLR
ncbi:SEC-C metal-binding domain-containing protein [Verminephrobacter eiseniae]|uniref:SEC-C metal-binding domain-containing protein n=1 Tax=Verminephrobacter eiseniae TaxID=364317 RepID=UPI0022377B57|nr:SEC-C metal-binding domain-containing protein [Verminephrobacter eiseniae]MCW5231459.1 preprotein translocase [Verminephrobacter eiseniae]MCW5293190.1 preprotein translocase [Verminephrobacter eiseniae]MCW8186582.1 preprotein translocase [Verminephrobacter eiseniae]MCW8223942.1 preprotein translocase [Verminephrobacter eiseniae]MCW8235702.1 preprotein translocase [Verminephrobacter eiseniae]